jgi:hypothetical protein
VWIARFLAGVGWERHHVLEPLAYSAYHDVAVAARGLVTVPYVFFRDARQAPGEPLLPRWQTCGIHLRTTGALAKAVDCVEPPWRAHASEMLAVAGPDGRTLAVWAEPQAYGGWPARAAASWEPGHGWTARAPLGAGSDVAPAIDGRGGAFVLRSSDETEHTHLWAHRFEAERGWLPAEDLMTPGASSRFGSANVAMETTGGAWAAWDENREGNNRLITRRYVPGAGWDSPFAIAVQTGGALLGPRVVVDGRGGGLFVWVEIPPEGGAVSIVARRYVADANGR